MNNRKLLLPEELIIEIMGMVAQLGNVAAEYHSKIQSNDTLSVTKVYERIIKKLMDLEEYNEFNQTSLEEICHNVGIKLPSEGDK
jgi:alpha-D-ribose 1-methylphosphonate 5-triphosphate diphosphatase PhnM|tara:strand:+ start:5657 stop:5911 length:255 start_codon:yes stop_codon:yes gene_type:complete